MEYLNQILYWISTGLMVPVVVLLIFMFIRVLVLAGGFYGLYMSRLKSNKAAKPYVRAVTEQGTLPPEDSLKSSALYKPVKQLMRHRHSPVIREKILSDFELQCENNLAEVKRLAKLGPVLGLMGTLIPMGPALVGLAAGDIASMAENMQVAFSTTVVGLLVGGIGFILTHVKQRWYAKDMADLAFIADLITEEDDETQTPKEPVFEP